jgi:carbamoyl-phosphate synthase small subunit
MEAVLALEDGRIFRGRSIGAAGERTGEVVFNTSMVGYQEVLTDPSYRGQIVTMTYTEIGNYGVNEHDIESSHPQVSGFVVRQLSELHSNWRASKDLNQYLRENRIVGIAEIDTRALTRHLRSRGVLRGCLSTSGASDEALVAKAKASPDLSKVDLVGEVTCLRPYAWEDAPAGRWPRMVDGPLAKNASAAGPAASGDARTAPYHIVAYDYGVKQNILRCLRDSGTRVTVVPAATPAADTLALEPDGVFLSNGPGDPASATYAIESVKGMVGKVPIFGICLGHQILGIALGAKTFKLKFGHRGANQPVKDMRDGRIAITSQNHGYAIDERGLPSTAEITHVNLNDGTIEGFRHRDEAIFSVQYHPESSPGPHDSLYLFDQFIAMIESRRGENPHARGGR